MKQEERYANTQKIISYVEDQIGDCPQTKFNIYMTALTFLLAEFEEDVADCFITGIEKDLKRLVKTTRKRLEESLEKKE